MWIMTCLFHGVIPGGNFRGIHLTGRENITYCRGRFVRGAHTATKLHKKARR